MGTKDTQTAIYCVFDDGKKVHNADATGAQRGHKGYTTGHKGYTTGHKGGTTGHKGGTTGHKGYT